MSNTTRTKPNWGKFGLPAVLLLAALLGSRDITNEGSGLLIGDMPRYVMNGVFVHDLIADGGVWSLEELTTYAERYFARYPALSLGHHPPLLYVSLVPFYALFGVKVASARLAGLMFFLLAAWGLHALARRLYGAQVAVWATLLFVTNVFVVRFAQYTLSEMPMLALVLAAVNALLLYCSSGRTKHLAWFVIAAAASLYAKQLAIFMFPVYLGILVSWRGWRGLVEPRVILLALLGGLLVAPLVAMTLALSPFNVSLVVNDARRESQGLGVILNVIGTHLAWPALFATAIGTATTLVRRDRRGVVGLLWAAAVLAGVTLVTGRLEPPRYAFAILPAYFLLAASLAAVPFASRTARWLVISVLAIAVCSQLWLVRNIRPSGSGGYETAARFVLDGSTAPVLYDSTIDTGFFVFFVRKHDTSGRAVVLRSEKLLTTLGSGFVAQDDPGHRISGPDEIYPLLQRFGVRYVVTEETSRGSEPLQWLHTVLRTDRFTEKRRIPIVSTLAEARGVDLVVYELKDVHPPDPDAELDIRIPLVNRQFKLRLGELLGPSKPSK